MMPRSQANFQVSITKDSFELASWKTGKLICGIDEVGRGCLAGPLVTACTILHPGKLSPLLQDSKLLTAQERLKAYTWLMHNAWHSIGIVHHRIIDKHNIWHATLIAMKRSLMHILATAPHLPAIILIDAMPLELSDTSYRDIPVRSFYKGELLSSSIAAASIIAKVTRDNLMQHFGNNFPRYHLAQHKGYSTQVHKQALTNHKPTIIHRHSFLNFMHTNQEHTHDHQQTIC
jgi:ribonuclease HII